MSGLDPPFDSGQDIDISDYSVISKYLMKFSSLIYVIAAVISAPFAYADDASDLNNLQRQIEAAKAAKKSKSAAAAQANPAPERGRQDTNALRMANLTIQSDASCVLMINGEKKTTLSAGVSSVKVPSGKSLVTCSSTDYTNVEFSGEVSARAGENSILRIELAGAIQNAASRTAEAKARSEWAARERQRQLEAEEKAQRIKKLNQLKQEPDCKLNPSMMEEEGVGVLRQCVSGLLWTQSDNAADIEWSSASRYCQAKGDWRLPSPDELKLLFGGRETIPCGSLACRVSSKLRLTENLFWTNEYRSYEELATGVSLYDGGTFYGRVGRPDVRALCVRRP